MQAASGAVAGSEYDYANVRTIGVNKTAQIRILRVLFLTVMLESYFWERSPEIEGATASVPVPWTPLETVGDRVKCWGREHVIQGPFPQQIVTQGQNILAGPVVFRFAGEALPVWTSGSVSGNGRSLAWTATAARGGETLRASTTIEYDGFWDIAVDLGQGASKGLVLEIPLLSSRVKFLHFVNETHYKETNTLALSTGDGQVYSDGFDCGVWVGDDDVGLQWVADSDASFQLNKPAQAIAIQRAGTVTTLRITLMDHAVTLTKPLQWRFGLIATPTRPFSAPRWRDWRIGPGASANVEIAWWQAWTSNHADTVPKDPAALTQQFADKQAKGQYLLPYVSMLTYTQGTPVYTQSGYLWRKEPYEDSPPDGAGAAHSLMCPNSSWLGFFPAQMENLFKDCKANGLYYDFFFPVPCNSASHPCGHLDAQGTRKADFQIFKMRKLAQDTYERVKAVRADSLIMLHASDALMYSCMSFGDLMLMGEEKRSHPTQSVLAGANYGHYMNVLPLEELRAEYRGHHAGLAPFIIPQFATLAGQPDANLCNVPGPTHELLALALLHDIGIWPIYCNATAVENVRVAQRDFGSADAEFAPYWEKNVPVELSDATLLASAWLKGASALIVIVNRGAFDVTTLAKFSGNASDALTKAAVGGTLTVPARGFRLIGAETNPVNVAPAASPAPEPQAEAEPTVTPPSTAELSSAAGADSTPDSLAAAPQVNPTASPVATSSGNGAASVVPGQSSGQNPAAAEPTVLSEPSTTSEASSVSVSSAKTPESSSARVSHTAVLETSAKVQAPNSAGGGGCLISKFADYP